MKNAVAEGVQMPFPVRDLKEENKALRAKIERLRKVLASNGLTSASALTHRHNPDLPKVPKQPEDRQERAKQRIVFFEACFMAAKMFMQDDGTMQMAAQDIRQPR